MRTQSRFGPIEADRGQRRLLHIRFKRRPFRSPCYAGLVIFSLFCAASFCATSAAQSSPTSSGTSWTVYHGNSAGSGAAASITSVDTTASAWTSPSLDGQLFGEPLVFSGRVYIATEDNTVYALSSSTGSIVWSTHIGTPVPATSLPCGDITPSVGITGTPVIDTARSEIFVVADELVNGTPTHTLVGLNITTGKLEMTQDVDPPSSDPAALLQRTGLTLDAGQVVFGMGGNYGDCSTYRGRVVAADEAGGTPTFFTVDAAASDSQGAVWMGGAAPAIDSSGHIWVSAGNGSVDSASQPYDDSDSVLELSSSLALLQYFAPSSWPKNNAADLDMSMAPALLSDGQVVLAGKSRIVYVLNGSDLGGIGGQEASLASGCGDDIDGGSAVVGTTVFVPCLTGIIAVGVTESPAALHLLWSSGIGGGPPIIAAGLVWTIGQNGVLYGLNPSTGKVTQQVSIGLAANHFPTPSVGDGLFLVTSADHVVAFNATTSATSTTSTPTSSTTSSTATSPRHSAAGASPGGAGDSAAVIGGVSAGGVVIVGGTVWVLWRRRQRRVS
jgi:polyvinyl alcohol dehydrogenase (cytochrome)